MFQTLDDVLEAKAKRLLHSSSTSAGSAGFARLDIAAARVLVKRLVKSGLRKGPSEMLILTDTALEQWYSEEAVAYLHEQAEKRCGVALELK